MKNTPNKGFVRTIIFKEKKDWIGVALEFNIVVVASSEMEAKFELTEAITGYLETARMIKGSRYEFLNQTPLAEYQKLWDRLEQNKSIPSPYQVTYFGKQVIYAK
jgi:hypothetical protein